MFETLILRPQRIYLWTCRSASCMYCSHVDAHFKWASPSRLWFASKPQGLAFMVLGCRVHSAGASENAQLFCANAVLNIDALG